MEYSPWKKKKESHALYESIVSFSEICDKSAGLQGKKLKRPRRTSEASQVPQETVRPVPVPIKKYARPDPYWSGPVRLSKAD